jgi:glycosyltransferase involved in cell wall biosynthesis
VEISVIIPVYNERGTIAEVIRRVQEQPFEKEIVVVDDCSTDGTRDLLQGTQWPDNVHILYHRKNQGKGAAIRTALDTVSKDIIIIQDADLEYNPNDFANVLKPILDGVADVVYGSRFLGGPHRVLYFWHYVANRGLTLLSNMATDLNLTDMETCYKIFRAEIIQSMILESDRFGFEPEVTAKIARMGCRVYEVPISYYGRTYAEGKKIGWRDGVNALGCIARFAVVDRLLNKPAARSGAVHEAQLDSLAEHRQKKRR